MSPTTLAARLRAERAPIALRVVDEMYADPFWLDRFPSGRKYSDEDLRYHVDHLAQALDAEDPAVLARYASWLQSILTTRGMCTLHLTESFARLGRTIGEQLGELSAEERTALEAALGAASAALHYAERPAGELQRASAVLADEAASKLAQSHLTLVEARGGRAVCGSEAAHLLSYLADATALARPSLFVEHAVWLASFVVRRGAPPEYVGALLDALATALEGERALDSSTRIAAAALLGEAAAVAARTSLVERR